VNRGVIATVCVGLGLGACRSAPPPVTPRHAAWAQAQWPATTRDDLERGRSLYMAKCSGCHLPPAPDAHPPDAWPGEVAEMQERAHLAPDEVRLIERYVVTLASLK
jgi:mono/diheme cytochrome c family protein